MTPSPSLSDEDPGHKAYQAAIKAQKGSEAQPPEGRSPELDSPDAAEASGSLPPLGPGVDVPAADEASGSPTSASAVALHESQLILRHTKLTELLPGAERDAKYAVAYVKEIKGELADIERLLRAHKRLREPVRRKRT